MAFDSLFIGVTGLTAYQNQIDVISNNIANVGSTGYKSQQVTFQDLLYQTQGFASAPTATSGGVNAQEVGLGVKVATTDTNFTQGGLQTTGINTDIALNGDGFFALADVTGTTSPTFTRDGHFSLNENGVLYDPASGKAVLGYVPNAAGVISQIAPPTPIQVPFGLKSSAVGTGFGTKTGPAGDQNFDVAFGGNLNQADYAKYVATTAATVNLTTITTTVYDSLGGAHQVQITFQPVTAGATSAPIPVTNASNIAVTAASEFQYTVTATDGTQFGGGQGGYIFFDSNGQFINTSGFAGATVTHVSGNNSPASIGQGNELTVTQWGSPANATNATPTPSAGAPGAIALDFSNMTALNAPPQPNTVSQNGFGAGLLSNISFQSDGSINGSFTNGQTIVLAKLAIATFQNEQGLVRVGSNQFQASANTGVAEYGFAGSGRFGSVVGGALEQSNVSIADEFTKLILAQRSFEANAKSITTADQDLQQVLQLKN